MVAYGNVFTTTIGMRNEHINSDRRRAAPSVVELYGIGNCIFVGRAPQHLIKADTDDDESERDAL